VIGETTSADHDITDHLDSYDGWILKLDATGNILWSKSIGGFNSESATDIIQLDNGEYRIAATSTSLDGDLTTHYGPTGSDDWSDCWVLQLDVSGNIKWQKTYGGSYDERIWGLVLTADDGMILSGTSASNDIDVTGHHGEPESYDFWIVKLNGTTAVQSITTSVSSVILCPGQSFNAAYTITVI
jgi:hypothetical protein